MKVLSLSKPYSSIIDGLTGGNLYLDADFINPFLTAAYQVLEKETACKVQRGPLQLESSRATTHDITVMVGVTGDVQGIVMYGMSDKTAKSIASAMIGERIPVFDEMAESAIAELGNLITGAASIGLEERGFICRLTPPTVIMGRGMIISTVNIRQLVVPVRTDVHGDVVMSVALRANGQASQERQQP